MAEIANFSLFSF